MRRDAAGFALKKAEALAALSAAAARFLREPAAGLLGLLEEEGRAKALRRLPKPARGGEWTDIGRCIQEGLDALVSAMEQARLLGQADDEALGPMARELREAAAQLAAALKANAPAKAAERLAAAKRQAAELERLRLLARAAAFGEPGAVTGLKRRGIYDRLSDAGESVQRAADALAGLLTAQGDR